MACLSHRIAVGGRITSGLMVFNLALNIVLVPDLLGIGEAVH